MEEIFAKKSAELLVLLLALGAAWIVGGVFVRLKQPVVLGEILAGIIIGPAILNFLDPNKNELVALFAMLGIVGFLFEVGLETHFADLKKEGARSFGVAIVGVTLPFILGYFLTFLFLKNFLASLFVGAALTATSIGITVRVLTDMKKLQSREGQIILGAAVIDDIIGLIFLSVILGMAQGQGVSFFSIGKVISFALIFLMLAIFVGMRFLPFLFKAVRKLQIAGKLEPISLIICFGITYLAWKLGLALIVGGFIAGLILQNVEEKKEILPRVQTLNNLFLPIFFVSAGAMFNPLVLGNLKIALFVSVILLVAILGKIVSGWGALKAKVNKLAIGIGMIPRGEVGLIFASSGLLVGVFDEKLYGALVAVIMLTTFITPILLKMTLRERGKTS